MKYFTLASAFIVLTFGVLAQNVGINNPSPQYPLDVNGDVNIATGSLRINGGLGTSGQVLTSTGTGLQWATLATGSGTVTSVGLSLPNIFTVSNSPVTTSGILTATLASQTANRVFAAPNGSNGTPTFRTLVANDIPSLDADKITSGTFAVARIPAGSANYIQNTTAQQASSNFNISGNGVIAGTLTAGGVSSTAASGASNVLARSGGGANWFPFTDGNNYISSDLTRIRSNPSANTTIADFRPTGVTIPVGLTVSSGLTASNGTTLSGGLTVSGTSNFNNRVNLFGQIWIPSTDFLSISSALPTGAGEFLVVGSTGRVLRTNVAPITGINISAVFTRTNSTWTTIATDDGRTACMLISSSGSPSCEQRISSGNIQVREGYASGTCSWRCLSW